MLVEDAEQSVFFRHLLRFLPERQRSRYSSPPPSPSSSLLRVLRETSVGFRGETGDVEEHHPSVTAGGDEQLIVKAIVPRRPDPAGEREREKGTSDKVADRSRSSPSKRISGEKSSPVPSCRFEPFSLLVPRR